MWLAWVTVSHFNAKLVVQSTPCGHEDLHWASMPLADKAHCCLLSVMGLGRTLPVVVAVCTCRGLLPLFRASHGKVKVAWAGLCCLVVLAA
jgi:hypothetical protein